MNLCEIKKGLFVLRTCKKIAKAQCTTCQKRVCSQHGRVHSDSKIYCVECHAQIEQKQYSRSERRTRTYRNWEENNQSHYTWYHGMKEDFHQDENYRPFEERDYKAFEQTSETDFLSDEDLPSFFDS